MSGHSKWATTKHKKAVVDARRGKLFAKLIKNVEVAARSGRPDVSANPTLYDAVQKAKRSSVPNDNIDREVSLDDQLEARAAADCIGIVALDAPICLTRTVESLANT